MRRYAALLFALVLNLSLVGMALASSTVSYSSIGTPIIDGELTTIEEWDGARKSNFTLNIDSFAINGSLLVMNDADNLYLAVKLNVDVLPFDQQTGFVTPMFDLVIVGINNKMVESRIISEGWFTNMIYDAIDYPNHWFSEFSHPLSSISLLSGDKVDFYIKVHFLGPLPFAGNYYYLPASGSDDLMEILIVSPDSTTPPSSSSTPAEMNTLLESETNYQQDGLQDNTRPPTSINPIIYVGATILIAVIAGIVATIYLLRLRDS